MGCLTMFWCLLLILTAFEREVLSTCSSSTVYLTSFIDQKVSLSSPNYPSNYNNNANCRWRIDSGTTNNIVVLEITNFALESGYDYLTTYDGNSVSSASLGRYSGTTKPFIYSTGRYLYLRFTSDSSVVNLGFQLNYFSLQNSASHIDCATMSLTYSTQAQLVTQGFPSTYAGYSTCHVTLDAGSGNIFQITVLYADMEYSEQSHCLNGGLAIYDGSHSGATQLLNLCNLPVDGYTFTSYTSSQYAYVTYKYNSANYYRGVVLVYNAYASSGTTPTAQNFGTAAAASTSTCSSQLSLTAYTTTSIIETPSYPGAYANNLNCGYLITTNTDGKNVEITISDYDIESCCDHLYIYDGGSSSYTLLASSVTVGQTYTSSGSRVWLAFTTDGSVTRRGFSLSYRAIAEVVPTCASTYTQYIPSDSLQQITSPNYPYNYYSNTVTYWLINKPNIDDTLTYYFESFRMEADTDCDSYDYLIVFNGACEDAGIDHRFCGAEGSEVYTHSYGKYLLFKMVTDGSVQQKGFVMKYKLGTVDDNDDSSSAAEVGPIAGGIVGGLIFVAVVIFVCVKIGCTQRAKVKTTTSTVKVGSTIKLSKPSDIVIKSKPPPIRKKTTRKTFPDPQPAQISIIPAPHPPQPPPLYPPPSYPPVSDPVYPPSAPPGGTYFPNYAANYPPPSNPSLPDPFEYKPAYSSMT